MHDNSCTCINLSIVEWIPQCRGCSWSPWVWEHHDWPVLSRDICWQRALASWYREDC